MGLNLSDHKQERHVRSALYGFYQPLTALNFDHVGTGSMTVAAFSKACSGVAYAINGDQPAADSLAHRDVQQQCGRRIGNGNWQSGVMPLNRHAQ